MVFNNFYSRLRDLFVAIKIKASKNNTKFGIAQLIDILFWNWFLVGPTIKPWNLVTWLPSKEKVTKLKKE